MCKGRAGRARLNSKQDQSTHIYHIQQACCYFAQILRLLALAGCAFIINPSLKHSNIRKFTITTIDHIQDGTRRECEEQLAAYCHFRRPDCSRYSTHRKRPPSGPTRRQIPLTFHTNAPAKLDTPSQCYRLLTASCRIARFCRQLRLHLARHFLCALG